MIEDELLELYSLNNILRYNNLSRIKSESVAEHSFFVSLIVARLHKYYKFDLGKALLTAVVHDVAEIWISDIPRNIKNRYKELDILIEKIEYKVLNEKYPEYSQLIMDMNKNLTVEGLIVKLADLYSVKQYVETEIKLGNTIYMPQVLIDANASIRKIKLRLEEYKK